MAVIKKGTYKFNDTVSAIPYETLKLGAGGNSYNYVLDNYGFYITPRPYMIESDNGETLEVAVVRISIANSYGDIYDADNQPTSIWEACSVLISRFGEIAEWHDSVSKLYGQEFTIPKDTEVNELTHTWFYENTELVTTTTATPTADDIKAKIQTLIAKANTTTGNLDLDLTSGVNALIDGYGNGDPVPKWDEDYTLSDDTEEIQIPTIIDIPDPITSNGTYTADQFGGDGIRKLTIDVPATLSISTEVEMTALLETAEVGSIYKYTGTTGTYENGALYVVESVTLITFTINSTTYQATEGMTWGEWVESDFNADGYEVSVAGIQSTDGMYVATEDPVIVGSNDEIIANETYLLISHVGGGA